MTTSGYVNENVFHFFTQFSDSAAEFHQIAYICVMISLWLFGSLEPVRVSNILFFFLNHAHDVIMNLLNI
jgi:hypothetical protein